MDKNMKKINIMLKPKTKADSFISKLEDSGFKYDKTITMPSVGSVIVGYANQITRTLIESMAGVTGIEDDSPISHCKKD